MANDTQTKYISEVSNENLNKLTTGQQQTTTITTINVEVDDTSSTDSGEIPDLDEALENSEDWKTPMEYYSSQGNKDTSSLKIVNPNLEATNSTVKYFWVEDLHNWCRWINENNTKLVLYVWNGKNDWDSLETVIKKPKKYFYTDEFFDFGVNYTTSKGKEINSGLRYGEVFYKTILLKESTKFSTYEKDTFQNIRLSKVHDTNNAQIYYGTKISSGKKTYVDYYDEYGICEWLGNDWEPTENWWYLINYAGEYKGKDGDKSASSVLVEKRGFVIPTQACPSVFRNASGQLLLCYVFKVSGNFSSRDKSKKNNYFRDEETEYLNEVCELYFGKGEDRLIKKHWKRINYFETTQEIPSDIKTDNEETLYNMPSIYKSSSDDINMTMTFTVPRPNVGNDMIASTDVVSRWNR